MFQVSQKAHGALADFLRRQQRMVGANGTHGT